MQVRLSGSVSSQYLTALLMAAPLAEGPGAIDILITDRLVSQPYVDMTIKLMSRFGVQVCSHTVNLHNTDENKHEACAAVTKPWCCLVIP